MKLVRRAPENPAAGGDAALASAWEELRDTGARLILGTQYRGRIVGFWAGHRKTPDRGGQRPDSAAFERCPSTTMRAHGPWKIQEGCDCHSLHHPSVRGGVAPEWRTPPGQRRWAGRALQAGAHGDSSLYGLDLPGGPPWPRRFRRLEQEASTRCAWALGQRGRQLCTGWGSCFWFTGAAAAAQRCWPG